VFETELAATIEGPRDTETSALPASSVQLAELYARGRAAFPGLSVDDDAFVKRLARSVARSGAALETLAVEDLFLACACADELPGALDAFEARCGAPIQAAIASIAKSEDIRDEIRQQVRDVLFVGAEDRPPKIATYTGQGALGKWVGVVAQRIALMMVRADKTEARARDGAAAEAMLATADAELAIVKDQYRAEFRRAMQDALTSLPERERLVMRLHLVGGMSVEAIGKMYDVSQSTASRWLAKARATIVETAQRLLQERLRVSPDEFQSLAALVVSQLDLSMSRVLSS
jgi:RNA polymerase sigma-70 factor (ECF subfamily)